MSTQGVNNIPSADVPQILTQGAGTSAPIQDYGENGAAVPERSLTALFNPSGQYVGSYGLDPSTGAFAAWDANGNETSFQAFAAEHELANGATPFGVDGGNPVLYNSSGQVIGLAIAGYAIDTPDTAQNTTAPVDGLTTVYDESGQNAIGSFGYSEVDGDLEIDGGSADSGLESVGFTPGQIAEVDQSLQANGGWDPTNATDSAVYEALAETTFAQHTYSQGTVVVGVYDAQGSYVGEFGENGGSWSLSDQDGVTDAASVVTAVFQSDGITPADSGIAASQVSTQEVPDSPSDYLNLRQINSALAAYTLAQGASSPLSNAVDVYDSSGNYYGNIGLDAATSELAIESSGGGVLDVNAPLLAQYGLSSSAITAAQQLWGSGNLTQSQAATLGSAASALDDLVEAFDTNPFENLTPAQVAAYTVQQLGSFSPAQVQGLNAADIEALSTAQVKALQAVGLTPAAISALSAMEVEAISPAQLYYFNTQQIQALGTSVADLSIAQFSSLQANALTPQQLAVSTPAQLAALSALQVSGLDATQLNSLDAQQLQALNVADVSWRTIAGLSGPAFEALTPTQIASLGANSGLGSGIQYFSTAQLQAIAPGVFATLSMGAAASLPTSQLKALTPAQLSQLPDVDVDQLSAQQINALSVPQIQSLNMQFYWQFANLSPTTVAAFTYNQVSSFALWEFQQLAAGSLIQDLTPSSINVEAIGAYICWLTPQQISALSPTQISQLSSDQLWESLNASQFAALTPGQIQAITTSQIAGGGWALPDNITASQVAQLTPNQVSALTTGELQMMSSAQIGALTPTQTSALTGAQISALSATQLQALSSTQLQALSGSQLNAMSGTQIAAFSGQQFSSFTGAQLASLSNAQMNSLTTGELAAMTVPQAASLNREQIASINRNALDDLTAQQIADGAPPIMLEPMPPTQSPNSPNSPPPAPDGYTYQGSWFDASGNSVYDYWNNQTSTALDYTYDSSGNLLNATWNTNNVDGSTSQSSLQYYAGGAWSIINTNTSNSDAQFASYSPGQGYQVGYSSGNTSTINYFDSNGNGLETLTITSSSNITESILSGVEWGAENNDAISSSSGGGGLGSLGIGTLLGALTSQSSVTITVNGPGGTGEVSATSPSWVGTNLTGVDYEGGISYADGSLMSISTSDSGITDVNYYDGSQDTSFDVQLNQNTMTTSVTAIESDGTQWSLNSGNWTYTGSNSDPDGEFPPSGAAPPVLPPALGGSDDGDGSTDDGGSGESGGSGDDGSGGAAGPALGQLVDAL
ncbi:MAG: hypothetical protein WB491_08245 [Candidatus Aquilonibacter sp.]